MNDLGFQVDEQAGGTVLKLNGQFTLAELAAFESKIAQLTAHRPVRLIIDMSDLHLLSSAGIGALVKLQRRATELKCDLRLAAMQRNIEDVIRAARLDSVFTISATLSDATA